MRLVAILFTLLFKSSLGLYRINEERSARIMNVEKKTHTHTKRNNETDLIGLRSVQGRTRGDKTTQSSIPALSINPLLNNYVFLPKQRLDEI